MARPRVLFLASRLPYPVIGGDRLRVTNCARILASRYDVDLLAISSVELTPETEAELKRTFRNVRVFSYKKRRLLMNAVTGSLRGLPAEVGAFDIPEVHAWLRENAARYDLAWCHLIRMAPYWADLPRLRVIDMADAISRHYAEARKGVPPHWSLFYRSQAGRVLQYEGKALTRFARAFVHTPEDLDWLASAFPQSKDRLAVSEMGVPEEFIRNFAPALTGGGPPSIGFLGKMNYRPNEDAAVHFARKVLPLIRKSVPQASFTVIGAYPTEKILELAKLPGIEVTGIVEDPAASLGAATVVVAPMRLGGGIQNKVLQAMVMGKPVVATPLAVRGIGGEDGRHFMVTERPEDMAKAVISLLGGPNLRMVIGVAARAHVLQRFTWDGIGKRLLAETEALLDASQRDAAGVATQVLAGVGPSVTG